MPVANDSRDADLTEIRDEFNYASNEKREIRDEGDDDMRAVSGDIWDPEERRIREEALRPVLDLDELGQYVNEAINDVRQNKRSIKVAPQGSGATDKTAEFRQNLIRQIEYRSNAQSAAYSVMYENTIQRSYGYLRIKPEYVNHRSNDQELRIFGVPNPNMVTEDPEAMRTDGADWNFLYFTEMWQKAKLTRKFPKAKPIDFEGTSRLNHIGDWFNGSQVMIAERWRIETTPRELYMVQAPPPVDPQAVRPMPPPKPQFLFEDEIKKLRASGKLPAGVTTTQLRTVDYPSVKKQILNGLDILEETDFPGTSIPFVACYGKVLYIDDGSGPKKKILSLIRLARSPLMLYCYYRTQQAEMAKMVPKVPVGGYKGQFASLENDWQRASDEPLAFIEFNFEAEGWSPQWGPMPRPERIPYSAGEHLQALELCAEGARRAIQAAIGTSPLPTQAQRHNEKSGVALQKMDDKAQRGSFHFVDHFDDALNRAGTILDELIPFYYDTARDVTVRQGNDQPSVIPINDPANPQAISATDGDHDVTLSVGPRESSEREAASNFADNLVGSNLLQVIGPEKAAQIIALAIRLKAVGPLGDEMADIISPKPPQEGEPPTPQQVQQLQQQVQGLNQKLQQAAQELQTDKAKYDAQVEIEKLRFDFQLKLADKNNAAKVEATRITAAKQAEDAAAEAQEERLATGLQIMHETDQAALDREHEVGMAALDQAHAAQAADQGHQQALEQGAVAHVNAIEQQAVAQPSDEAGA